MNNLNLELSSRDSQIDELTEINRKLKKDCQIMQDSIIAQNIKNVENQPNLENPRSRHH